MKLKMLSVSALAALIAAPAFGNYIWNNFAGDNDFANMANWSGTGATWIVALDGTNRAILGEGYTLFLNNNFGIGRYEDANETIGGDGEVEINGSTISFERVLRLGASGFDGKLTMTDGIMNIGRGINIGQDGGSTGTLVLTGGTINANIARINSNDRLDVGADGTTGILEMSGSAVINFPYAIASIGGGVGSVATVSISENASLNLGSDINAEISAGGNAVSTVSISDNGQLNVGGDARIGEGQNAEVMLDLSGDGALVAGRNARVGFGVDSRTTLNISGGLMSAPAGFIGFGQGNGADVIVNMSGGVINADRLGFANSATSTAALNMTGGTINLLRTTGTATHAGGLRMQSAGAALQIGGDAVINAQKLYISDGGLLTLSGDALINISGSDDGMNFTFDITRAFLGLPRAAVDGVEQPDWSWGDVDGQIEFASPGASIRVAGATEIFDGNEVSFVSLFNEAVANNVFSASAGFVFDTGYVADGDFTYVTVIPDSSSASTAASILSFSMVAGTVLLEIDGPGGREYSIETSTDLVEWSSIETLAPAALPFVWTSTDFLLDPRRFYRVSVGP